MNIPVLPFYFFFWVGFFVFWLPHSKTIFKKIIVYNKLCTQAYLSRAMKLGRDPKKIKINKYIRET
jgi:hypothetical protein